jgi:hypothetical protein
MTLVFNNILHDDSITTTTILETSLHQPPCHDVS